MEKALLYFCLSMILIVGIDACKSKDIEPTLVGQPGDPRFNLVFTNPENVDMDLHVLDPKGNEIYFGNQYGRNGGELDIDCLCGDCPNGPNENIFWTKGGNAPKGTYKYWVEYYESCSGNSNDKSDFTLRIAINEVIKSTQTGTLSRSNRTSEIYTWIQQ